MAVLPKLESEKKGEDKLDREKPKGPSPRPVDHAGQSENLPEVAKETQKPGGNF